MNKKGFTLIELIATITILAIIMLIAIPNVVGIIDRNKKTTYIEDAKKLATLAEYKYKSNTQIVVSSGQCTVMTLNYLDATDLQEPPNGGIYDLDKSYVGITLSGNTYKYYVTLVEVETSGATTGNGVPLVDSSKLNEENAINNYVKNKFTTTTPIKNNTLTGCGKIINLYS